jgi:hypothetical protein
VRGIRKRAYGCDRAEDVRHRGEREHPSAVEQPIQRGDVELPVVGQRHPADLDALLRGDHLPRHDVGVVLHVREHHHIAGTKVGPTPCLRDEVERLGRVLREHDLVRRRRVDEPCDLGPRAFVRIGRCRGEAIGAAVDRRVVVRHEVAHGVDDDLRLLRRVRRVEVHDRLAIDLRA